MEAEATRDLKRVLSLQESASSRSAGLAFVPRAGDVFIVTPPKSGTTLVQQIVQSLRTRGDMAFDEICMTIPCLEMAEDHGYGDLSKAQSGCLNAFKTHFWHKHCPHSPDAKYIYVLRDPVQASTSFYHFFEDWCFQKGTIGVDAFVRDFVLMRNEPPTPMQNAGFWHHIASWYPHRHDSNVLWLHYEDLVEDLDAGIRAIAGFVGIALDEELLDITKMQASREFMQSHREKYDEHMLKLSRNEICGLARDAGLNNCNQGKVRSGVKVEPSKDSLAALQQKWVDVMLPICGASSYAEMRRNICQELAG